MSGEGQILTLLTSEPLMHKQVRCFTEEIVKGHFDIQQKKIGEYHILFWLAEGIRNYFHGVLLK